MQAVPAFADQKPVGMPPLNLRVTTEDLPFRVVIVRTEEQLRAACKVRSEAYGRHIPEFKEQFAEPDELDRKEGTLVFLAEDYYFYLPGKFQSAVEFLRSNPDASFVSLYDHPDNYVVPFQQSLPRAKARTSGGITWHARAATTHSFLARKATLQKCRQVFRATFWGSYKFWGSDTDTAHWLALTKTGIFSLPMFLKSLVKYRYWAACMVLAWIFRWRQILFGERYTLWTPSPSIATHMSAGLEAPGIDWQKEFVQCLSKV